jgi:hypothetical protein
MQDRGFDFRTRARIRRSHRSGKSPEFPSFAADAPAARRLLSRLGNPFHLLNE